VINATVRNSNKLCNSLVYCDYKKKRIILIYYAKTSILTNSDKFILSTNDKVIISRTNITLVYNCICRVVYDSHNTIIKLNKKYLWEILFYFFAFILSTSTWPLCSQSFSSSWLGFASCLPAKWRCKRT
jgi:hypothetical protein